VVLIRPATPGDAAAIAALRAQSWQAAYTGIIPAEVLAVWTGEQMVAENADRIAAERWRIMIVAAPAGQPAGADGEIIGFAAAGPERAKNALPVPPGPEAGQPARTELYAIYVAPAHWSSGAGRALLAEELERARAAGSGWISLWVLEDNVRARRFYERSGFADTGERLVSPELGGVVQVRYERPVS